MPTAEKKGKSRYVDSNYKTIVIACYSPHNRMTLYLHCRVPQTVDVTEILLCCFLCCLQDKDLLEMKDNIVLLMKTYGGSDHVNYTSLASSLNLGRRITSSNTQRTTPVIFASYFYLPEFIEL